MSGTPASGAPAGGNLIFIGDVHIDERGRGSDEFVRFLDALAHHPGWRVGLLGVNRRHVSRRRVVDLVAKCRSLALEERLSHFGLPSDVYVLVRRKSPSASASSPVE